MKDAIKNLTGETSSIEKKIQQNQFPCNSSKVETYLGLTNEFEGTQSLLEFDLITARQKGEEIRYLSILLKGVNAKTGQEQDAFISVDQEAFGRIKEFFTKLTWTS